jgi:hypothetical protein
MRKRISRLLSWSCPVIGFIAAAWEIVAIVAGHRLDWVYQIVWVAVVPVWIVNYCLAESTSRRYQRLYEENRIPPPDHPVWRSGVIR